jgi:hypothetical protein
MLLEFQIDLREFFGLVGFAQIGDGVNKSGLG